MHRSMRMAAGILALSLAAGGCYGPFNLTRRLYRWNGDIQGKWEKEFVFLLLAVTHIYSLVGLGDAIVFNAMEFWTGNNPVDPPGKMSALHKTKRIVRGDVEAVLTYRPIASSPELIIEQFHQGQSTGTLRLQRRGAVAVGLDAQGHVLLTAQRQPNGTVVVSDAQGRQVASYSVEQVQQFAQSVRW